MGHYKPELQFYEQAMWDLIAERNEALSDSSSPEEDLSFTDFVHLFMTQCPKFQISEMSILENIKSSPKKKRQN